MRQNRRTAFGTFILLFAFLFAFTPLLTRPVQAAPAIAPPNLTLTGTCDGAGNSVFTIKNLGGAMTVNYTWELYQNGVFLTSGTFLLTAAGTANDTQLLTINGLYGTLAVAIKNGTTASAVEILRTSAYCVTPTPTKTRTPTATPVPPNLTLTGTCDGAGNSVFTIKNLGGAMTVNYTWELYQNGVFLTSGTFLLTAAGTANDTQLLTINGLYGTLTVAIKNGTTASAVEILRTSAYCVTPTPTKTKTPTKSKTPTITLTPTKTLTPTITPTRTKTLTPTKTATITQTSTITLTPTITFTPTVTNTPSITQTSTTTATSTVTETITATLTESPTATITLTPTISSTPTETQTATITLTPTVTESPTETMTPTNTGTATITETVTATATESATATITATPTNTETATITFTPSVTETPTITITPSMTNTGTLTVIPTDTQTPTITASPSVTRTATPSATPSITTTALKTATATRTRTPTIRPPRVVSSNPTNNAVINVGRSILVIKFSKGVILTGNPSSANNVVNYLLVKPGQNHQFNTSSCRGRLAGDDVRRSIDNAIYIRTNSTTTVKIELHLSTPVTSGKYRLFVCGTTSIKDIYGNRLNGGMDTIINFQVATLAFKNPVPTSLTIIDSIWNAIWH